jgi:hypothetical protein
MQLRTVGSNPTLSARSPQAVYSPGELVGNLARVTVAISRLRFGLPIGSAGLLFSDRPASLRSSGLDRFGTVLEIRTFRVAYELWRKEVWRLLSDGRERPISNRHLEVRILPRQPRILVFREFSSLHDKSPQNAGSCHRELSLEINVRAFWAENSQKSPAESGKTPVF